MATPTKCPPTVRPKSPENPSKIRQENSDPNLRSPTPKLSRSPSVVKSGSKPQKSVARNPTKPSFASPRKKIKERKFVVAKKSNPKNQGSNVDCKCKDKIHGKCLCVAYENLRASQEEFFKSRSTGVDGYDDFGEMVGGSVDEAKANKPIIDNMGNQSACEKDAKKGEFLGMNEAGDYQPEAAESPKGLISSTMKRRRDMLLEEARQSVPDPGSGRVLHLVKAFEKLLTIPKDVDDKVEGEDEEEEEEEEETKKGIKWALPGLQQPPTAPQTQQSSSPFCPGELFFNADSLGLDSQISSSLDNRRGSVSSRSSAGSRRSSAGSRRSSLSSGSAGGRGWKKKQKQQRRQQQEEHKVTSQRPFNLRTEQRGKAKEEEFFKKLQEMMIQEEKQRIPIAQGLPWTTDEPECLVKPPVKECTKPIDLTLYSDVRAVERAEFDNQVADKLTLIEQYRMEKYRQQKLEEEEEVRRLRKELVPKAQPMPYFDKPFVPRRSVKQPTIPKEPKFRLPQQKKIKCSLSLSDFEEYVHT